MSNLHLSGDDRQSVQSHIRELGQRIRSTVILTVILTVVWSFSIDVILHWILSRLDPCTTSCINVFSPDEWASTRWLSSALLGLLTAAPFAMIQAYTFAERGLLPSERRAFVIWMTTIWGLGLLSLWFVMVELMPWIFVEGHSFQIGLGLVGLYDASEMLRISVTISWAILLILAAMSVIRIAGSMKLLWMGNSGWWRFRVHGFMLMLLWLVIPSNMPGLMITLTLIAVGFVELSGWNYFRASAPDAHGLSDIFDEEGGIHRVLYVDCSCCGSTPSISPLPGMGIMSFNAVCRYQIEQNYLIDSCKRFGVTDIVFSGCSLEGMPPEFMDSLRFLDIESRSLDLSHLSTLRTHYDDVDLQLAMAALISPWSKQSSLERINQILSEREIKTLHHGETIPFGLQMSRGEAWLSLADCSAITISTTPHDQ